MDLAIYKDGKYYKLQRSGTTSRISCAGCAFFLHRESAGKRVCTVSQFGLMNVCRGFFVSAQGIFKEAQP